jgi:hypothetical protein
MIIVLDDEASAFASISILFRLRVQFLVMKCDQRQERSLHALLIVLDQDLPKLHHILRPIPQFSTTNLSFTASRHGIPSPGTQDPIAWCPVRGRDRQTGEPINVRRSTFYGHLVEVTDDIAFICRNSGEILRIVLAVEVFQDRCCHQS